MSIDNFDGDGLSDQPSIVYGFDPDNTAPTSSLPKSAQSILADTEISHKNDEVTIRELSRSGYGQPGPSPGDVLQRDATKSTLDTRLPQLDLPGTNGLMQDDCGEDIPAFACLGGDGDGGCGKPVYVGRTCASPLCERDWPAAVKDKTTRLAGKLDAYSRILHNRTGEAIHQNHVVASLPSLLVDSATPVDRAYTILKSLLRHNWGIEGFAAVFHPFRIKQKHRKDQYSHGGADGEGEMTWKDVLSADTPREYLTFEPHFHLFFPSRQSQFSYSVVPGVYADSGWVFHRIEKSGEDNHKSVEDLSDLVHQLTYCFSHAGVHDNHADRHELSSRMKGDLVTDVDYVADSVSNQALAAFCDAAPKLLGTRFVNLADASCDAEVHSETETELDKTTTSGSSYPSDVFDLTAGGGVGAPTPAEPDTTVVSADDSGSQTRELCGGSLSPIRRAVYRLDDRDWCAQAAHVDGLRKACEEWKERTDGDEVLPWTDDDRDGSEVVQSPD